MNSILINFDRSDQLKCRPDWSECIANVCLGVLRLFHGKTVAVRPLKVSNQFSFEERKQLSFGLRAGLTIPALLISPLIIVIAVIGCTILQFSRTHAQLLAAYGLETRRVKFERQVDLQRLERMVNCQDLALRDVKQPKRTILYARKRSKSLNLDSVMADKIRNVLYNRFNPLFNHLVGDIFRKVFENLTSKDLGNLALTCMAFRTMRNSYLIEKTKVDLSRLVTSAKSFNEIIMKLTNGYERIILADEDEDEDKIQKMFAFNSIKWSVCIKRLNKASDCNRLITECRLDLVESLAEYNMEAKHIFDSEDVKGHFFDLIESAEQFKEAEQLDKELLWEAKNTEKTNMYIKKIQRPKKKFILSSKRDGKHFGIELGLWASINLDRHAELEDLNERGYLWFQNANELYFAIDLLLGKREGDRLTIPPCDGKKQVILRCLQTPYEYGAKKDTFEEAFVNAAVKMKLWKGSPKGLSVRAKLLQEMEAVYGHDYVEAIIQSSA